MMGKMIRYEWKKIWQGRLTQLAMLGCTLFFIFCIISNMSQTVGSLEDGSQVYGMSGIMAIKESRSVTTLTQEETDRLVREYLDYTANPETNSDNAAYFYLSEEVYRSYYLPHKELLGMIDGIYRTLGSEASMKEVFEENLGRDILQARLDRDVRKIDRSVQLGTISDKQGEYWKKQIKKIHEPLSYGYCEGWKQIYFAGNWAIIIMMIVGIGVAPIFAGEYQSKCDSLFLCMKYGKSKLIISKVLTAWLFTTFVYIVLTAVYSIAYLLLYGAEGGDLPIQLVSPWLSVGYPLTMKQGVLLVQLLAYVFTLCLMAVTLLLSSLLKNAYGVIVIILPMAFVLALLSPDQGGYFWSHILSLFPSQIVNFAFESYMAYGFFGKAFSWLSAGMIVDGICAIAFSCLSYFVFKQHQVNR